MRGHDIQAVWPAGERVMVLRGAEPERPAPGAARLAGGQPAPGGAAGGLRGDPRLGHASPEEKRQLEENLRFAEDLGAKCAAGKWVRCGQELARVAHEQNVANLFIGHPRTAGCTNCSGNHRKQAPAAGAGYRRARRFDGHAALA